MVLALCRVLKNSISWVIMTLDIHLPPKTVPAYGMHKHTEIIIVVALNVTEHG